MKKCPVWMGTLLLQICQKVSPHLSIACYSNDGKNKSPIGRRAGADRGQSMQWRGCP